MWNDVTAWLTFLPFSDGPPAARREAARDLFKVDVIVPILVEGVEQACNKNEASKPFKNVFKAPPVMPTDAR